MYKPARYPVTLNRALWPCDPIFIKPIRVLIQFFPMYFKLSPNSCTNHVKNFSGMFFMCGATVMRLCWDTLNACMHAKFSGTDRISECNKRDKTCYIMGLGCTVVPLF